MNVLKTLAILVATALAAVGCWFGYWALAGASQSNRYEVNTHSQQYQAGLISQERDRVTAWTQATDPGQKQLIRSQFCAVYLDLTQRPTDLDMAAGQIGCQ